jgi:Flp pilus assembly CpaE family ATPase
MNIAFLMSDEVLIEAFMRQNKLHSNTVVIYRELETVIKEIGQQHTKVLVASDQYFNCEGLSEFTESIHTLNSRVRKILLLSNYHDQALNAALMKESLADGWIVIHPGHSTASIVEQLSRYIFGETTRPMNTSHPIIQFLGSTPNIGTTVAAFGTAMHLAMQTHKSVAYICLNLKSSKIHRYISVDEPQYTLENMRVELKSLSLTSDKLRQYAHKVKEQPNLHVVFGNMQREQAEFYSLDDIDCLLETAAQAFDYCIVDTNAYWDNAATISTMKKAGIRILVTTGQLGHFQEDIQRWLHTLSPVFGISPRSFDLLITQKGGSVQPGSYSSRDIRKETGMQRVGEIHSSKDLDSMLNQGRLWDVLANPGLLREDLAQVAGTLLTLLGDASLLKTVRTTRLRTFLSLLMPQRRSVGLVRK